MANAKSTTPALRFKGFDEEWKERKLGECFKERQERSSKGELISVTTNSGIKKFEDLGRHDNSSEDKSNYKRVVAGDIAYNSMRMWQGASGYSPYNGILSPAYTVAIPNSDIDSRFFAYMFKKPEMIHTFQMRSQGVTSDTWNMKFPTFREIEVSVPMKTEQKQIAKHFSHLDSLIALQRRKLVKLQNVKKAMLQKMFPTRGSTTPQIRFAGFTDSWEPRSLSDVVAVGSGRDYKHLDEGNIPVYGTGGYMLSVDEALSYNADAVGIGRKGTIDKPYLLKAPFWTVDTLFYCIPKRGFDLRFSLQLFRNIDWRQKDESTGVPSLSKETINTVEVLTPRLNEQKRIGDFFKHLDTRISLQQRKLEKLQNVKKACLAAMFV